MAFVLSAVTLTNFKNRSQGRTYFSRKVLPVIYNALYAAKLSVCVSLSSITKDSINKFHIQQILF
jgi:hypothetical protein